MPPQLCGDGRLAVRRPSVRARGSSRARSAPVVACLAVLCVSSACAPHAQPSQVPVPVDPPVVMIHPGDMVHVVVWRQPEMSGDFLVGADSAIVHPLYQRVQVAGVPIDSARARMREYLTRFDADPQFVLQPLVRVAVGGEVGAPNLYSLPLETTVSQAIAQAGGPTERGRLDRVRVVRGGEEFFLDLSRTDTAAVNVPVQSGDRIFITRKRDLLRQWIAPLSSIAGLALAIVRLSR
ncbi:MAG TPA: SLBB domain-containing protein [Gemmatimonadaceae bacterium]|nr:SLBB domain-containing protein [Gemmatimonadaceae bacterium]